MKRSCERCWHENPPAAHYCGQCGAALAAAIVRPAASVSPALAPWRTLRRDLTRKEVRRLLGEPARIELGSTATANAIETWEYAYSVGDSNPRRVSGTLSFCATEGRLLSWSEPDLRDSAETE